MNIAIIAPIQPVAKKKAGSERFGRGKRGNPDGFSKLLHGMVVARATEERKDGFNGQPPQQRSTDQLMASVVRRIEQVNSEIQKLL